MSNTYQQAVREWVLHTFGKDVADDVPTRCFRFFEEAGELCQSLGMTKEDALKLVEYTWGRPPGEAKQEVGGVMVTLAAMLTPVSIDMVEAGWVELGRCWSKVDKIREKQRSKAKIGLGAKNPLPGHEDLGKWVTLQRAVPVSAVGETEIYLPQGSWWRIVGEYNPQTWVLEDQTAPQSFTGQYAILKSVCSKPRVTVNPAESAA